MSWLALGAAAIGAIGSIVSSNKSSDAIDDQGDDARDIASAEQAAARRREELGAIEGDRADAGAQRREDYYFDTADRADSYLRNRERIAEDLANRERDAASRRERYAFDLGDREKEFAARNEGYAIQLAEDRRRLSKRNEDLAYQLGEDIQGYALDRENAGEIAAQQAEAAALAKQKMGASAAKAQIREAQRYDDRLAGVYENIESRYSPFVEGEQRAANQMQVELGLVEGDVNRNYRTNNPAYLEYMDASQVAQREDLDGINQEAGNDGTLYSGRRGEALTDRYQRGSFERAGIEQSYYQNYLDTLEKLSNPNAVNQVSGYEAGINQDIGRQRLDAQQTASDYRINTAINGREGADLRLNSMRTGEEGLQLMSHLRDGGEGGEFLPYLRHGAEGSQALNYMASGREGSQYLDSLYDPTVGDSYRLQGLTTGTEGSDYRMGNIITGREGNNAILAAGDARRYSADNDGRLYADLAGGIGTAYDAWINRPQAQGDGNNWGEFIQRTGSGGYI